MKNYKKLVAWQKGLFVAKQIYELTSTFPKTQQYRLCDQMERASVSIISNIAEGSRRTADEWKHYLRIALGSASELESQLLLARELKLGESKLYEEIDHQLEEVSKLLYSYIQNTKNCR
jgi:four helix bundle protein